MRLAGKTALITGGNSGIGLATAKQFVNEGAYVYISGRRDIELAAAVTEIGKNVAGIQGDVSNLGDLDRLFGVSAYLIFARDKTLGEHRFKGALGIASL
jgi:NAD(P)-dependent dehydrogenase (short-subunit alcohol dehydrogenase family)